MWHSMTCLLNWLHLYACCVGLAGDALERLKTWRGISQGAGLRSCLIAYQLGMFSLELKISGCSNTSDLSIGPIRSFWDVNCCWWKSPLPPSSTCRVWDRYCCILEENVLFRAANSRSSKVFSVDWNLITGIGVAIPCLGVFGLRWVCLNIPPG